MCYDEVMEMKRNVQIDVDSANIARIVPLRLSNVGITKISKELKLTQHYVSKIVDSDEFKLKLRETADEMSVQAINTWKVSISNLVPKAVEVLKTALDKDDLEAVKLVVRSLGIEKQETQVQQGNITVVMPDYSKQVEAEVSDGTIIDV